ncbi:Serine/threonine-protein kinase PrkC [Aquisphaera giovannonii]|uniref:non-specific serine/threonine protein kinase n=1 Tax=Aquisphaera giovannonii TaxID=406548 RepID=A0A5B9W5E0_9BACT|nr:protein kinase [Aquisphaera giovannonii]QEH35190.1 Serine/threonine-protein kinase PrkC [Aquisphaera giovannonii]
MIARDALPGGEDPELAEVAAEAGERLRRGEDVRPEDYPRHAEALRDLLPTLRMMAGMPAPAAGHSPWFGRLGDFRLVREVSRGGMGIVYEAVQESLGRRVALKVLPDAAALDPRSLRRFQLESQAAASLDHPHIVPVYATGSAGGIPYYAMRFIDGRDLAKVLRALRRDDPGETEAGPARPTSAAPASTLGPSRAREAARLARQAAEALDHAHAADVLHRDVKPSNLLIDDAGGLWVADFGLARIRGGLDLTHTGDALGTPRYMSPEQAAGRREPLDGRSDIYSLGATLYEMLTLRPAFPGDDRIDVLRRIAQEEPPRPRSIDPTIPVDLETIVLKAMAKSRRDRYATAADLAADLGRFLDDRPILARRPGLADHLAKWTRRNRRLVLGAAAALALVLAAAALGAARYISWLRRHEAVLQDAVGLAGRNAAEAERLALEADRQRRLAQRHYLAAQLRLAQQAVDAGDPEVAQELLDAVTPAPGPEGSGRFAWGYLRALARREVVRLPELDTPIHGMSLSRDGRTVATNQGDATLAIWDLPAERIRLTIAEPGMMYREPHLTGDGRILVAPMMPTPHRDEHTLGLWDATTGELRAIRRAGHPAPFGVQELLNRVHFLAGERLVAHVLDDGKGRASLRIWALDPDPAKALPLVALDDVRAAAFAPEGRLFATLEGGGLRLRDASTGAVAREAAAGPGAPGPLAISPDGRLLAACSGDGRVVVRGVDRLDERARYDPGAPVVEPRFDPTGRILALVAEGGKVHLWDWAAGRSRVAIPDDLDRARDRVRLAFSPDGRRFATQAHGDPGGEMPLLVWDAESGRRLGALPYGDRGAPEYHLFAPDGRSLVLDLGRSPKIWRFDPPPEPPQPAGHRDEAWALAFSPDGSLLATGSDDDRNPEKVSIKLWEPATGRLVRGWYAGEGTVAALAFSPDGRTLVSGHLLPGRNLRAWDVSTGRLLRAHAGHPQRVRAVAVAPDGRTVVAAGGQKLRPDEDWTVRSWELGDFRGLRSLAGHEGGVRSVKFSPDGRLLASAGADHLVRTWDAATGAPLASRRRPSPIAGLAFAPDGRALAVADESGGVALLDPDGLAVRSTIRGATDRLLGLAYAPDGQSIATCGRSGVIRLWDAVTGQELLVLKGHKSQVNALAFSPDGSTLASCSHDGEVHLWRAR